MRFLWFAVAGVYLAAARPVSGQVSVVGLRDLAFGPVFQSADLHVLPSDAVRAGQFRLVAAAGSTIRVQFDLPTKLEGPSNGVLKIRFGSSDGIAARSGGTGVPVAFDPTRAQTFTLGAATTLNIYLGGIVSPAPNQSGGAYTNTITLTVTVL
jgi:hypothetical protein